MDLLLLVCYQLSQQVHIFRVIKTFINGFGMTGSVEIIHKAIMIKLIIQKLKMQLLQSISKENRINHPVHNLNQVHQQIHQ